MQKTQMVDLVTRNYIHTLFLYEFGVSQNVAIAVRMALEMDLTTCKLYADWMKDRIMQNKVPYFRKMLFENEAEMRAYRTWYWNGEEFDTKPKVRFLNLWSGIHTNEVSLLVAGKKRSYELDANWNGFLERRSTYGEYTSYENQISENEFYEKLDNLFNVMTLTDKIPFELCDVK